MAEAEEDFREVLRLLAAEMGNVSTAFVAQGISQVVSNFDGSPRNYRDWVNSIEKYSKLVNLPDNKKKLIAYQTSKGAVSGYIQRYMTANPDQTWGQLKEELALRFSDVTDSHHAMSLLRALRQGHYENIQVYAEILLSLAEIAFHDQGGPIIEGQLIDIFVDGLNNEGLKMTILRRGPDTLQAAISLATTEQNLKQRVNLATGSKKHYVNNDVPQPMEVDHSRTLKCYKCKKFGHMAKHCKSIHEVQRKIKCWHCGQEGHIIRFCKNYDKDKKPNMGHGRRLNDDLN